MLLNTSMHHKVIFLLFFTMVSTLPLWGQNISGKIVDDSSSRSETSAKLIVQDLLISSYFCTFIV